LSASCGELARSKPESRRLDLRLNFRGDGGTPPALRDGKKMEVEILNSLSVLIGLTVWVCRLVSVAIGVLLFRFVSLRSTL
jgi:hypothetical protein